MIEKISILIFCALTFSCSPKKENKQSGQAAQTVQGEDYTKFVNPFIGTDGPGNTYPGAQVPFGSVQLSPDNGPGGWDRIAGYFYPDSTIASFSMTHLSGTGAGDLYDIAFMPVTRPFKNGKKERIRKEFGAYSTFSHTDESATAGYYAVKLKDYNIFVELTATERTGVQRYTFPQSDSASVFLDLNRAINWDATMDSHINIVDSVTVTGYRFSKGWAPHQKVFFTAKFSKPFSKYKIDEQKIYVKSKKRRRRKIGVGCVARFDFETSKDEQIIVKCAISPVSIQNSTENLNTEVSDFDFNKVRENARKKWNDELSKIDIKTKSDNTKTIFYTCLYQSMLAPTIFMDVNGEYRGADLKTHTAKGFTNYTRFSLWDTYRAAHPLYTILQQQRVSDMINSFLNFYDEHKALPLWNLDGEETDMMIGYHAVAVIAEAYLKGIKGFDEERALNACVATANRNRYRGIGWYKKLGYIPYNKENESLSKTLEYAYDDFCIAAMAQKMGKTDVAKEFFARAQNYKNLYNPKTGWLQPRDSRGKWIKKFAPDEYSDHITESNAWHYAFSVQHDIEGLMTLLGGEEYFRARLDSLFIYENGELDLPIFSTGMIGQYAQGNEPSHHVAYLYDWTKTPWKTQRYVREILKSQYTNEPYGHCGNEDCGQMSSWFVFSAMGFYPVNPVSCEYALGSPLVNEAVINLPEGKTFTITAEKNSDKNIFVKEVYLNEEKLTRPFISHDDIMRGGKLLFIMTDKPKY